VLFRSDPFQDPTGISWQILQGLSWMYAGGLWGEGFGRGNPEYTPIAESDFIYSVIGEEAGLVGCVLVILFFLILFHRGLRIAHQIPSPFGSLVCGGLTSLIALQTFLNIGGVTKFIPLTGITLPFISHGGSSLVTGFASLGLILAISDGVAGRGAAPAKEGARKAPRTPKPRAPRRKAAAPADPGGGAPPAGAAPAGDERPS
jgi:cell division protein FtsW (lipid II flippase)